MGLTTDGQIVADGGTFSFPDNESGTIATREWVQANAPSGEIPGIDDVLAVGQQLTDNHSINLNGNSLDITNGTFSVSAVLLFSELNEFADNAAAISGGVPNLGFYFTTVSGERIIKQAHD